MNNRPIKSNGEQLESTADSATFCANFSPNQIHLGVKSNDTFRYGLKPQSTSIPKSVESVVHKPPIETIKLSDFLSKKNRDRFFVEHGQLRKKVIQVD